MYLGHFALTEWLTPKLTESLSSANDNTYTAARVVNIVSDAMLFGSFHKGSLDLQSSISTDLRGENAVYILNVVIKS